jgi:predicted RNase H-like nuclease
MLRDVAKPGLYVAGVDGCSGGWVAFIVDLSSQITRVERVDLASLILHRPHGLAILAIDMPIGLIDGTRSCDSAARRFLGFPRCCSVFPAPCREAAASGSYPTASGINYARTGKRLTRQTWEIAPKIREIDDLVCTRHQEWVYEVHPEVSFWRMNGRSPMKHSKSRKAGRDERRQILLQHFPEIDRHIDGRPRKVGVDDVLDAAVAAWSALRLWEGTAESVCDPGWDDRGLRMAIHY